MYIYIADREGYWYEQRFEILPSNTPTLDETLETFSFALLSNDIALPFAPMQKVRIYFNNNSSDYTPFYIQHDSVETCSLNPIKYKHTITCVQNTRELSKHLVRNSVFTQPSYLTRVSYNALSMASEGYDSSGGPLEFDSAYYRGLNVNCETLSLINGEKIKSAKLKISFQWAREDGSANQNYMYLNAHTPSDILDIAGLIETLEIPDEFQLEYKDANNTTNTVSITPASLGITTFDLNSEMNFPLIKTLADQGCNNFKIKFVSTDFLTGNYWPSSHTFVNTNNVVYYQVQLEIVADVYYYTCYDVLDLLIKRQRKQTSLRTLGDSFALPQSGDLYDLLKTTPAPNFTFTQLTLYECVAEVFRVFDAIFTLDNNGVLGIEYFNDISKNKLPSSKAKFTGRTLSLSEDKYTNGLVSHYQDARIVETFPFNGSFAPLRGAEFGIVGGADSDHNFIVPHNIDSIVKCEIYLSEFKRNDDATNVHGEGLVVDITRFVVEENVWGTLDKDDMAPSDYENYTLKQADSVFFRRGDNKIQVAGTFKSSWGITQWCLYNAVEVALDRMGGVNAGLNPTDALKGEWGTIKMRLQYIASVDGVQKIHSNVNKYEGETLVDQANGAVDLNKLGLNILGLTLKLGNPTLNATHKITTWANRIKVGDVYEYTAIDPTTGDYKTSLWVANVVNYTFLSDGRLQGKVSFVQNFNALALRTQLLREKRMSNISRELVQKSEEVLTDYIYYSSIKNEDINSEPIHFGKAWQFVVKSFALNGPFPYVGDAFVYDQNVHPTIGQVVIDALNIGIYIPIVKYGAGNTVNFEMSFEHPMNAGNQTWVTREYAGITFNVDKYETKHVIYTNESGFREEINIKAPRVEVLGNYDDNFPVVYIPSDQYTDPEYREGYFDIKNFKVYKQPNEIFALNYQIAFLPFPGRENTDFIGNEWINHNCFVDKINVNKRKLKIVLFPQKNSILDRKATGYAADKEITSVSYTGGDTTYIRINFAFDSFTSGQIQNYPYWAIVDEESNVLFASNEPIEQTDQTHIYFYFKLNRLS